MSNALNLQRCPFCVICGAPSTRYSPRNGDGYCSGCGKCSRCHTSVEAFVYMPARVGGAYVCPCVKAYDDKWQASQSTQQSLVPLNSIERREKPPVQRKTTKETRANLRAL